MTDRLRLIEVRRRKIIEHANELREHRDQAYYLSVWISALEDEPAGTSIDDPG